MALKKSDNKTINNKAPKLSESDQVIEWMNRLDPDMKLAVDTARKIIRGADSKLNERIKWNAPSYYYKSAQGREIDLVTFGPQRGQHKILLVFHHPDIVKIKSTLLTGEYKDRRLTHFNSLEEIKAGKKELARILTELVRMLDK